MIIRDIAENASNLNSYCASVLCCNRNIPEIKLANSGKPFIIITKVIRKITKNFGETNQYGQKEFLVKFLNLVG